MIENVDKKLSEEILTRQQATEFELMLSDISDMSFKTKNSGDNDKTLEILKKFGIPSGDKASIDTFIHTSRTFLRSLRDINISIGFEPSHDFSHNLKTFFDSLGYTNYVLNIKKKEDLGAGCELDIGGKFYDLTLCNNVKNYMNVDAN